MMYADNKIRLKGERFDWQELYILYLVKCRVVFCMLPWKYSLSLKEHLIVIKELNFFLKFINWHLHHRSCSFKFYRKGWFHFHYLSVQYITSLNLIFDTMLLCVSHGFFFRSFFKTKCTDRVLFCCLLVWQMKI